MNVRVIKLMFFIGIIGTVLELKMNNYVNNFPSTGGIFVFIRFPQKVRNFPSTGGKNSQFSDFSSFLQKKLR